jgi:hypothetical protein
MAVCVSVRFQSGEAGDLWGPPLRIHQGSKGIIEPDDDATVRWVENEQGMTNGLDRKAAERNGIP